MRLHRGTLALRYGPSCKLAGPATRRRIEGNTGIPFCSATCSNIRLADTVLGRNHGKDDALAAGIFSVSMLHEIAQPGSVAIGRRSQGEEVTVGARLIKRT